MLQGSTREQDRRGVVEDGRSAAQPNDHLCGTHIGKPPQQLFFSAACLPDFISLTAHPDVAPTHPPTMPSARDGRCSALTIEVRRRAGAGQQRTAQQLHAAQLRERPARRSAAAAVAVAPLLRTPGTHTASHRLVESGSAGALPHPTIQ